MNVDPFLAAEVMPLRLSPSGVGSLAAAAGIGTMAPKVLAGWGVAHTVFGDPAALVADESWQLAVVLSPWKLDVAAHCTSLSPAAEITGVVDTVARTAEGAIGFNTNTWAAEAALVALSGSAGPDSVLLVGSGASARSVALAVRRAWPGCTLLIAARRAPAAAALAERFGATVATDVPMPVAASRRVIVNATTWGETEGSEEQPMGVDLSTAFGPGVGLFDLNNRVGALPAQALAAGSVVVSGPFMQRHVNAMRMSLVPYAAPR